MTHVGFLNELLVYIWQHSLLGKGLPRVRWLENWHHEPSTVSIHSETWDWLCLCPWPPCIHKLRISKDFLKAQTFLSDAEAFVNCLMQRLWVRGLPEFNCEGNYEWWISLGNKKTRSEVTMILGQGHAFPHNSSSSITWRNVYNRKAWISGSFLEGSYHKGLCLSSGDWRNLTVVQWRWRSSWKSQRSCQIASIQLTPNGMNNLA